MARIPEAEVERLKSEVSLQRLVEARGIELKKHGADLIARCPFHDDRTPSLVISPSRNLWHCLGACQTGGSVIDWVMKAEGVSFRHAVELLRADAGISTELPKGRDGRTVVKKSTVAKLAAPVQAEAGDRELLLQVVGYYHETLKQSPEVLAYLESRGLRSSEMVERFRLGFANRTLGLRLPAKNRQAGDVIRGRLTELGIVRTSGHEHLNGSLVIPVFDETGAVVEMYGRKITPGLRKGTPLHLYLPGRHRGVWNLEALTASKEIILCESLIDALTFWCAGYRNVTASYGVEGFTADHIAWFRQHGTERVLIAYDRDEAGDRAAVKLSEKLSGEGIATYRVQFPRGMDANEYALKVTPAERSLGIVLRKAEWMGKGKVPSEPVGLPSVSLSETAEVQTRAAPAAEPAIEPVGSVALAERSAAVQPSSVARPAESPTPASAASEEWPGRPMRGWPWDQWYKWAVAAGVSEALADLGRAVMGAAEEHGWDDERRGLCGWNDDGAAMIERALAGPEVVAREWQRLLDTNGLRVLDQEEPAAADKPAADDQEDSAVDDEAHKEREDEPVAALGGPAELVTDAPAAAPVVPCEPVAWSQAAEDRESGERSADDGATSSCGSVEATGLPSSSSPSPASSSPSPPGLASPPLSPSSLSPETWSVLGLPPPARPSPALSPPILAASPEPAAARPPTLEPERRGEEVVFTVGDRRYRVRGLGKNLSLGQLRVNVLAARGESFFADQLDLHSARQRQIFLKQAADELGVGEDVVKKDLGKVLLALEGLQENQIEEAQKPKEKAVTLSEKESEAALALLRDPKLLDRILGDFVRAGVVGEEDNKLVGYVAAVSRKLEEPLAVIIQSSSAAGKSSLMDAILAFVPEEERVQYSAMTGQSLFYMGETDLQHKILAIVEEEGAERASYALKLLQSEGELTIASTGKDPETGKLVTQEYRVEGPVMIFLTTTAIEIDEELLNRCLVLTVDEDREQTRAIHRKQRAAQTLAGLLEKKERDAIVKVHRDAQRLLRPLLVANPFAEKLTFVDDRTRTRRDHMKYLTLIRTIALLHQYQRPVQTVVHGGEKLSYIEVTVEDIAVANRLAHQVLGRSLDELPPQTRRLLLLIDQMVVVACGKQAMDRGDYRFTRREVREVTGWGNTQLKVHLGRLEEMEYLAVHRGGRAGSFRYELCYDGQGQDGRAFLVGLTDPAGLCGYDETGSGQNRQRSGENQQRSGPGRGVVGPKSGDGRGDQSGPGAPQKALNGRNGFSEQAHARLGVPSESASYAQPAAAARTS